MPESNKHKSSSILLKKTC